MNFLYTTLTFLLGCLLCLQNTSAQIYVATGPHGVVLYVGSNDINFDDPQAVLSPFLNIASSQEGLSLTDVLTASDRRGNTLLHIALKERASPEAIQVFLDSGAPLHQTNLLRVSPIEQVEQMVREKLEDLQREYEQTSFLQRNIIQNWQIHRQWRDWFERRYNNNTRRHTLGHPSSFSCPPGTKHSMDYSDDTHHCIPQQFRFYEEHVYALIIIAEKDREQLDVTPTDRP